MAVDDDDGNGEGNYDDNDYGADIGDAYTYDNECTLLQSKCVL